MSEPTSNPAPSTAASVASEVQSPPGADTIDSRRAHHAALLALLESAAQAGTPELWWCDRDFADWPLGQSAFVAALDRWIGARRTLTLLAADYERFARVAPRWHAWRRQWSHAVRCLVVHEELAASVPSLMFAPGLAAVRLHDPERSRGLILRAPADLMSSRELCEALAQRSSEGLPVTTLGL